MTYDSWKTTNPDDEQLGPMSQCDCCGKNVARNRISRCWAFGIETFACMDCSRDPDEERERRRDDAMWEKYDD